MTSRPPSGQLPEWVEPRWTPDVDGAAAEGVPFALRASDEDRRQALEHLDAALAAGMLDLDEYARRSDESYQAGTRHELHRLVRDLPVAPEAIGVHTPTATVRASFGTYRRQGHWECPGRVDFVLRYATANIDFGQARFHKADIELHMDTVGSRLRLYLPRGSTVISDGLEMTASRYLNNVGRSRGAGRVFRLTGRALATSLLVRHRPLI